MHYNQAHELIDPYRDGELSPAEMKDMQDHLTTCASCSAALADYERIGQMIKTAGREPIPPGLVSRIGAALDQVDIGEPRVSTPLWRRAFDGLGGNTWGSITRQAAAFAAVSVVTAMATISVMNTANRTDEIGHDILNAHLRSLLLDSPVQVASSDQHTVRPWFSGRVDFSPSVRDLATDGFPLIGGRLDYVNDRRVGAVVYRHDKHIINVFMWASPNADQAPHVFDRNGYNIMSWSKQGVAYWAVSDVDAQELRALQRLF
jgi:anti-sigma factor RsiW